MILVTGSITAMPGTYDDGMRLSLEHVHRSRLAAGTPTLEICDGTPQSS